MKILFICNKNNKSKIKMAIGKKQESNRSKFGCGVIEENKKHNLKLAALCSSSNENLSKQKYSLKAIMDMYKEKLESIILEVKTLKRLETRFIKKYTNLKKLENVFLEDTWKFLKNKKKFEKISQAIEIIKPILSEIADIKKENYYVFDLNTRIIEDLSIKIMYLEDIQIIKKEEIKC